MHLYVVCKRSPIARQRPFALLRLLESHAQYSDYPKTIKRTRLHSQVLDGDGSGRLSSKEFSEAIKKLVCVFFQLGTDV